ncbi:methyl-accepting chemotaxis protein [Rhodovulum kholense]|uniref:Methyl-accepting chemotaxis protein n=1 Tax=Rhodovulum kholense TaxID=453584 RepID=A0A8E3ASW7_9RHOB|nr:HAMP domain-containing methyl-accepting chemotaxis protein [Rhodovulum kholense]PTW51516.1 methyl-accepting chemotaxis protein [Rhodovulum kholense]
MRFSTSIRTAILAIVTLASAVMLGLIGVSLHVDRLRDATEEHTFLIVQEDRTLAEVEIGLLHARRAEKDFLLRHEDSFADRHKAALDGIARNTETARDLSRRVGGLEASEPDFSALTTAIRAYGEDFDRLVEIHRRLGYDEESGLQGELRNAVHGIEARLEEIGNPEMQVKMLMMRRHEKDFILRGDPKYLDRLNARVDEFHAFPDSFFADAAQRQEIDRLLATYQAAFTAFVQENLAEQALRTSLSARFAEAEPILERLVSTVRSRADEVASSAAAANARAERLSNAIGAAGLFVFVVLAIWLSVAISRPLRRIDVALRQMMKGDYTPHIGTSRISETAAIAAAVDSFRHDLEQKDRLDRDISEVIDACAAGDFSKRLPDPGEDSNSAVLVRGVNAIGEAAQKGLGDVLVVLNTLSKGDLTVHMPSGHHGVFSEISASIDTLVSSLSSILRQLSASSDLLNSTARKIASASDEASHRGQNSAASLEETAAALQTLANNVRGAADSARSAEQFVEAARDRAENTRTVADKTVGAIRRIEESSGAIGRITGMIEDVAFQTNLLALNAGVEAARAGEAGRGFAVVASEVRALAQRATEAAREITALIRSSETHVGDGVKLVSDTVAALAAIQDSVTSVCDQVAAIAANTIEQSTSITEINTAVGALDRDVQQNAAILDETATAGQMLRSEADSLVELVKQFRLPDESEALPHRIAAE